MSTDYPPRKAKVLPYRRLKKRIQRDCATVGHIWATHRKTGKKVCAACKTPKPSWLDRMLKPVIDLLIGSER